MSERLDAVKAKFQELVARRAGLSTQSRTVVDTVDATRADVESALRFAEDPTIPNNPDGDRVRNMQLGKAEDALKRMEDALKE